MEKEKDYVIQRKRIWKGKVSPQGRIWLVCIVKKEKTKYRMVIQVSAQKPEPEKSIFENKMGEELRKLIKQKYGV